MKNAIKRVEKLIDTAEPKENLQKWLNIQSKGKWIQSYIPKNYKKLSISMDDALRFAKIGAEDAYTSFGITLFFTQAMIWGAIVSGAYKKVRMISVSQYGKSWFAGALMLRMASMGEPMFIVAATKKLTDKIMREAQMHVQTASAEIKELLLEPVDKIERMLVSTSKDVIGFKNGGSLRKMSTGENFNDSKMHGDALGDGGGMAIDEAALITDAGFLELGRAEQKSIDGIPYLDFQISNPHQKGQFMSDMIADPVPADMLVVWMDLRTSIEEGRENKTKEEILNAKYARTKQGLVMYYLCEMPNVAEGSMFGEPKISEFYKDDPVMWFAGIDSAYKGNDSIEVNLTGLNRINGDIISSVSKSIDKSNWIEGETDVLIADNICKILNDYNVKMACLDIGQGIWLSGHLHRAYESGKINTMIVNIDFSGRPTPERVEKNSYNAKFAYNKRAEMHMDFAELIEKERLSLTEEVYSKIGEQMNATELKIKPNGKKIVIPKEDIKLRIGKSPDQLDSAILALHAILLWGIDNGSSKYYYTDG